MKNGFIDKNLDSAEAAKLRTVVTRNTLSPSVLDLGSVTLL